MQLGFNTNFRYRGVLFHVQTEDSGIENPHVITHLFHGGNIMASEKRDYSELLGAGPEQPEVGGSLEPQIRSLMESQHKKMLKALSAGAHDETILLRCGADIFEQTSSRMLDVTDTTDPGVPAPAVADSADSTTGSTTAATQATIRPTPVAPATPVEHPADTAANLAPDAGDVAASPPPQAAANASVTPKEQLARAFGDSVVSKKPLDEVVLDFLVENARKRKNRAKS